MPLWRRLPAASGAWAEEAHRVARELLGRLDPWSYWIVQLEPGGGADLAVVGTTGAFAIAVVGPGGYVVEERGRLTVDGVPLVGFREVKAAAKRLEGRLAAAGAYLDVAPLVCLSRATAGRSRTVRGVRVVRLEDLVPEIVGRERTVEPGRGQRAARFLGHPLSSGQGARPEVEDDG